MAIVGGLMNAQTGHKESARNNTFIVRNCQDVFFLPRFFVFIIKGFEDSLIGLV